MSEVKARLIKSQGKLEEALEIYQALAERKDPDPMWLRELTNLQLEAGRQLAALGTARRLSEMPGASAADQLLLREILRQSGDVEGSKRALAEAAEKHAQEQADEQARRDAELEELRRKVAQMQAEKAAGPVTTAPEPDAPATTAPQAPVAPVEPVAEVPAPIALVAATPAVDTQEMVAKRRVFVALRGFDLNKQQAAEVTQAIAGGFIPHVKFQVQE